MEDLAENLIGTFVKLARIAQAVNNFRQTQSEIEEQKRRDELRRGSIDVEYKIIE